MDVLYASANGQKELLYCANTAAAIFFKGSLLFLCVSSYFRGGVFDKASTLFYMCTKIASAKIGAIRNRRL